MRQGDALGVRSAECCDAQRRGGRYPVREQALSNSDADGAGRRWELPRAWWHPVLEGECDMRVPQVSERIKEAPAHALRGVFAGIGQLLLITDKLRNKASHQDVSQARTPVASKTVTDTTVTSPAGREAGTAPVAAAAASAEAVTAESVPAKPAARPRRTAAKPVTGKPVTTKPPAKPATAKPATPRRTAAKAAAAEAADSAGETAPKPPKRQSARNFDKTGNVRVLGDKTASAA